VDVYEVNSLIHSAYNNDRQKPVSDDIDRLYAGKKL